MKRFLMLLMTFVAATAFASAAPRPARLTPVRTTHPPVGHHRAHRATRHHGHRARRHAV